MHYGTLPPMCCVNRVLPKELHVQKAVIAGNSEIWIIQITLPCEFQTVGPTKANERWPFVSRSNLFMTSRRRLTKPSKVLPFGNLGDRRAQLGQVVRRLALETTMHLNTYFVAWWHSGY